MPIWLQNVLSLIGLAAAFVIGGWAGYVFTWVFILAGSILFAAVEWILFSVVWNRTSQGREPHPLLAFSCLAIPAFLIGSWIFSLISYGGVWR